MKTALELEYLSPPVKYRHNKWPVLVFVLAMHGLLLWGMWQSRPVKVDTEAPALNFVNLSGTAGSGADKGHTVATQAAAPAPRPQHVRPTPQPKPTPVAQPKAVQPPVKPVVTQRRAADLPPAPAKTPVTAPETPAEPKVAERSTAAQHAANASGSHGSSQNSSAAGGGAAGKSGADSSNIVVPTEYQGGFLKALNVTYPPESLVNQEEGDVVVTVAVAADGVPTNVRISKSSGYNKLDRAARRAVQNYRFKPATRGGVPIPYTYRFTIRFNINAR